MKNELKIGVILSYINMILSNLIAIFYTPIMLRILGQNEYGLYQLAISTVSYLGLLSFGFGSSYVRFFSKFKIKNDKEGIKKLNGMFITVFLIISLIALIAGGILTSQAGKIFSSTLTQNEIDLAKILMYIAVFNIALSFPSSVFDSYITAHESYFFQRLLGIVQVILNPFLSLPLLLLGYGSVGLVFATSVLSIIKFVTSAFYCIKKLKMQFSFKKFDFLLLKEIWVFSFYIFLNIIVDQINWSVDKFVLGVYIGSGAVAIYSIGAQINSIYMSMSTSISSVFIPRINDIVARDSNNNEELTDLFTKIGRIQFIVLALILVGFVLLGKYFIQLWAGSGYGNSYYVALLLVVPVTVPLIQNVGIEIQRAKNMHKFRSILYFFIALCNVIISIPLVKNLGEIGAAIGTMISLIVGNIIVMNIYYHTKVGINIKRFWKEIFKLLPGILLTLFVGKLIVNLIIINNIVKFVIAGIIIILLYIIALYLIGFNEYEKLQIKHLLTKRKRN